MERNEKKSWLPVATVWAICIAVTMLVLREGRTSEEEIMETSHEAINYSMETENPFREEKKTMIIGTAETCLSDATAETFGFPEEAAGFETVRESTVETAIESDTKTFFQPETHIVPRLEKNREPKEETVAAESAAETMPTEKAVEITETEETAVVKTEAPIVSLSEEETTASVSKPDSGQESVSMVPYEYRCSEAEGIARRESYEDRFFVSFHRTAAGETMSFDYITYDTRWISALEKRYPEEDPEHAASVKTRFATQGSVYSYRVSDFRDGVSWINILPDDLVVIVEEGGKDGIRYYTAEGYNRTILPDL